jgi:hypothetical protein
MRAVLLVAAAAAAENGSAWRERLGLQNSACPAECPLRHRSIVNITTDAVAALCRLSVLGRWASFLPSDEKAYVNDLATTCRGGNATRATTTPRPTASPVQHTERDQRSASVPMPPLLMRLINNLW